MKPKLIVVVGPTASGKTQLGIELAKQFDGAVISADSRQVYAGMSVGSAKPGIRNKESRIREPHDVLTPDLVDGVEHYLLDIREPDNELTLADWQAAAFEVIDSLVANGRTPLLVGGTMLYVDSVVFNYAIPEVKPDEAFRQELADRTTDDLYAELTRRDPKAVEFIEPGNLRRIVRALEVMQATGKPFSALRTKQEPRYDVTMVGLFPQLRPNSVDMAGWDTLRERVRERAQQMFAEGLLEETLMLIDRYGADLPLLHTLNYRQAKQVIDGTATKKEAVEDSIRATMRYARRQMSWWRGRDDISWLSTKEEARELIEKSTL